MLAAAAIAAGTLAYILAGVFGGTAIAGNVLQYLRGRGQGNLEDRAFEQQVKITKGTSAVARRKEKEADALFREAMLKADKQRSEDRLMQLLQAQLQNTQNFGNQQSNVLAAAGGGRL